MKTKMKCEQCGALLVGIIDENRRWCNPKCGFEHRKQRLESFPLNSNYISNLGTGKKGAIGELRVCVDLLEKDFEVFRSVNPSSPFDLVVFKEGELFSVEVKSSIYNLRGKPYRIPKNINADILAIALPDKIIYKNLRGKNGIK